MKAVSVLAPDRYDEFRCYYEASPKRKTLEYGTYVIQDYLKGVVPSALHCPGFNSKRQAGLNVFNQMAILRSLSTRIDSVLANLEQTLYAELRDAEVETARKLMRSSPRAAGTLAGVILEGYLQKVAQNHNLSINKKSPTIGDLNDSLKQAGIYDMATWRKISYLGDIRNLCSHKRDVDPSPEQVKELIEGVNWVIKNIA